MIHGPRIHQCSAFTLVELMVALAVSSIVVLMVYEAYGSGQRLWHRAEDGRFYEEVGRHIVATMRQELSGVYVPPLKNKNDPVFQFYSVKDSGEQKISFFTTMPCYYRGLPSGRCAWVTYEYRKTDSATPSGGVLIRREQLVASEKAIAEPVSEVIAEGISSFLLQCIDDEKGGKGKKNPNMQRPPKLVQLSMSWPFRDPFSKREEDIALTAQFIVPVQDSLLPEKQE